jgi:hypothetical protein
MASTLWFGNSGLAPEEFTGLSVRYSDPTASNGQNVLDAGGSGADNSSIWLVVWGGQSIHGIFPKGSKAGLLHEDMGEVTVETTAGIAGTRMRAYQDRWQWKSGIALKDWRYVVRIGSIDLSDLRAGSVDIIDFMIRAIHRIPNLRLGRPVFYMNRTVFQELDLLRRSDVISGGGLTFQNVDGVIQYSFRGIPVRISDALIQTEALV